MKQVRLRQRVWLQWLLAALVLAGCLIFLDARKDKLLKEFADRLAESLGRQEQLDIHFGKISGHVLGWVSFQDVEVKASWLPMDQATVFKAKEVQFRYPLMDFLTKQFDSSVQILVKKPEVYWRPHAGLRKPDFPFMEWLKRFALSQKKQLLVRVEDMSFTLGYGGIRLEGIDLFYKDRLFRLELPLNHLELGDIDFSSTVRIEGFFHAAPPFDTGVLKGRIRTEGTIVNWQPLVEESQFDFSFSSEKFELASSSFLGGTQVQARADFTDDYNMDLVVKAQNYPLSNIDPFSRIDQKDASSGRLDMELRFYGSPWEANVTLYARLYNGWIGKRVFKAMDVHAEGIYPTVRLTDSRIILEDGSVMRFADRALDVKDLFKEKTYESLIAGANQETVVWGDWELSRLQEDKEKPAFLMERVLSDKTRVQLRKWVEGDDAGLRREDSQDMEVGFEYRLRSKDSLKVALREDEEFVGIERKMKF